MKEYCVDLEIAKELNEKGFPQGGRYYDFPNDYYEEIAGGYSVYTHLKANSNEILKELPKVIDIDGYSYSLSRLAYSLNYENYKRESFMGLRTFSDKKSSNALRT